MIRNLLMLMVFLALFSCKRQTETIEFHTKLINGWTLTSSENLKVYGDSISKTGFNDGAWYKTTIPSTVLNALVKNNVYTNIYFGNNLSKIPTDQFKVNWWYRKVFDCSLEEDENIRLVFDGINYRANIWLNGKLIASSDTIESSFRIFDIDITGNVLNGKNALAVEIIPPKLGDLTIGFVDWNPWAPDNDMGIWREVHLLKSRGVSVKNTFIKTDVNTETLKEASLNISTNVTNHFDIDKKVKLLVEVDGKAISKKISLKAKESKLIEFTKEEYAALKIKNPKLWWPNNLGKPDLYSCRVTCYIDGKLSDEEVIRFGIRKIEQYMNEEGHRGYMVNGKKILIKGGGWVDDLLLSDTEEKVEAQIEYVKHMNLNTIRLEGFWGNNKAIYDKADENGILIMIGWSCHWEWEGYCGRPENEYMSITSPEDMELQAKGYRDQVVWLRNHPSIFVWVYGSDKLPHPDLERKLNKYVEEFDPTRPVLASCKYWDYGTDHYNVSEVSGPTAVKMLGPYGYVTPNYWYLDKKNGGAFGFNTETGPGPQVPPIESIKKMLPQENYWPIDEMWEYHLGRNEFQTLNRYLKAFNARYGEANSLDDFAFRSQISNYEAIRAMFESFEANKHNTTGIVQWMLNSAWPEMFWQLYDWYLMPNGAFYGTKVACQPLNLIYNYADNNIYISNDYNMDCNKLEAEVSIYDINSKVLLAEKINFNSEANLSKKIYEIPEVSGLSTTYFLDLRLKSNGKEESKNFYWLSTKKDVPDFENTQWHFTPYKEFADFSALAQLSPVKINVNSEIIEEDENIVLQVNVENPSEFIAFFIELKITNKVSGEVILPVLWEDNYISLLPGEKRVLKARFKSGLVKGSTPVLSYKGLNVK